MKYYIWSFEHNAWWRADWRGYTTNFAEAGQYSQREALKICRQANWNMQGGKVNEAMVPVNA